MPFPPISPTELQALVDADPRVRVVDVRSGGEFESAHIPGAYNVPIDALGEHQRDLVELGEPVVLVCQSGTRACRAESALLDAGMDNVRVLAGGMNAWQQEGREVVTLRARWPIERQVRLVAGALVAGSIAASVVFPKAKWLAGGIGAGLTVAALTDTCAMGSLLTRLPYNRPAECDVDATVARLRAGSPAREAAA
jgi:rhodanese-related sulfurtransferase